MTEIRLPELDQRTLDLIERAFGERLSINTAEASKLLGYDRRLLNQLGDNGEIDFFLKGTRQRRYSREDIKSHLRNRKHRQRPHQGPPPTKDHVKTRSELQARLEKMKRGRRDERRR